MFKTVYPNLDLEMKQNRYTVKSLAESAGIYYMTLYNKVKTGKNLTMDEALKIKATLGTDLTVEELFKKVAV